MSRDDDYYLDYNSDEPIRNIKNPIELEDEIDGLERRIEELEEKVGELEEKTEDFGSFPGCRVDLSDVYFWLLCITGFLIYKFY